MSKPTRHSKIFPSFRNSFVSRLSTSTSESHFADSTSPNQIARSISPSSTQEHNMSSTSYGQPETVSYPDTDLLPPSLPFGQPRQRTSSNDSSRRSSFVSNSDKPRPQSLSVNYVPAKFTKLHAPGEYAHRNAKLGGGRDVFASDASRMGQVGMVDDDEGIVYQIGKGGLKRKDGKPKLRWNHFKWIIFGSNSVVCCVGQVKGCH